MIDRDPIVKEIYEAAVNQKSWPAVTFKKPRKKHGKDSLIRWCKQHRETIQTIAAKDQSQGRKDQHFIENNRNHDNSYNEENRSESGSSENPVTLEILIQSYESHFTPKTRKLNYIAKVRWDL